MNSNRKVRIILVTDGDSIAQKVVEEVAQELDLRCISASGGNPTPISGETIVKLLMQTPKDPVVVMFDDRGRCDKGDGEWALDYVARHPNVEVLGALAVASNTCSAGVTADVSITKSGQFIEQSVDKYGDPKPSRSKRITGDTVDVLNDVCVPVVVGIGDIGKMDRRDDLNRGAPITRKAIEEILIRSGIHYEVKKDI